MLATGKTKIYGLLLGGLAPSSFPTITSAKATLKNETVTSNTKKVRKSESDRSRTKARD
jgi:5-enolpyruvylshikimate-3-phosphate synthase